MKFDFTTSPEVCSENIAVEITDNKIANVRFDGGCPGSLQAVSRLVIGMTPQEAIQRLDGIRCGGKSTSCPDQLAKALKQFLKETF